MKLTHFEEDFAAYFYTPVSFLFTLWQHLRRKSNRVGDARDLEIALRIENIRGRFILRGFLEDEFCQLKDNFWMIRFHEHVVHFVIHSVAVVGAILLFALERSYSDGGFAARLNFARRDGLPGFQREIWSDFEKADD